MELRPISIRDAKAAVKEWHRHLPPPGMARFALAAYVGEQLVGVAMVGNPKARMQQDGRTAEVIRVATDGTRNACSFLYARAKRAAQALGFTRVLTKTLPEESGASLRAVGARQTHRTRKQSWDRKKRPRPQTAVPPQEKIAWEL